MVIDFLTELPQAVKAGGLIVIALLLLPFALWFRSIPYRSVHGYPITFKGKKSKKPTRRVKTSNKKSGNMSNMSNTSNISNISNTSNMSNISNTSNMSNINNNII